MDYPVQFVEALLGLARVNMADGTLHDLLADVSTLAVEQLDGCDMAGVTLIEQSGPTTTAFTDPMAVEIDEAQYASGQGPCLEAFRDGLIIRIEDTATDERWPEFCKAAFRQGVRSTLSLPLRTETASIGALNLYSRSVAGFDGDEQLAGVFVAHAAATLANARAYWVAQTLGEQLQAALASRAVIEQAKGILMFEHRCDADRAFELLKLHSQVTNTKLRDVAKTLVDEASNGTRAANA